MLIVQVCDFPLNGQGFYRSHEPSRCLSRCGVVVVDCDPLHHLLPLLAETADVLILQVYDWDWIPLIHRRRARKRITVVEASDDYFDVHPWNPGSTRWADEFERELLRQLLTEADGVQTTTKTLARRWAPWARRLAVFANHLPEIPPLRDPPVRPLTVGWGGSGSHLADWYAVCPVLQTWLDTHPDVHLAVMTDDVARSFLRLPPERYHFRPLGSLAEYLAFLRSLDIGLAPLLPTDFNRARSDLKYLEYAAQGVVGVYADREPFAASVRAGETGLLFRTGEELRHHLDTLTNDVDFRNRIRRAAHADVGANRRLADHIEERLQFYRELGAAEGSSPTLPAAVVAAANSDANYLQLRPGRPEQVLASVIERPSDAQTLPVLLRLVEQHPLYEAALLQLGYLLNEGGQSQLAQEYLQRALGLNPNSPRALCELARTLAATEQPAEARRYLELALSLNPAYPLAWLRLFHLLSAHPNDDAARWFALGRERHPRSWVLALAGLGLLPEEERLARLKQFVETLAPEPESADRAEAVAGFGRVMAQAVGSRLDRPDVLDLLRCEGRTFPESMPIAVWLGEALDRAGEHGSARQHYIRALELKRSAEASGGSIDERSLRRCLVAVYAHRWME